MTTASIEAPTLRRSGRPRRTVREVRPARRSARTVQPTARSLGGVAAPQVQPRRLRAAAARSCTVATSPQPATSVVPAVGPGWRLTNRGIAVIMIAGALLLAAAVTVITATAVTVTSDDYRPAGSAITYR